MTHPIVENKTKFEFQPLPLQDEYGRPLVCALVKATYVLTEDTLDAEEQLPILPGGEFWDDPETSSYKYEPEVAFAKVTTDVCLVGDAHSRNARETSTAVTLRVGDRLQKTVRVFGDRVWKRRLGIVDMTNPEPFETIEISSARHTRPT